ncbi:MAG TPA: WD40 repeat domain-containing protein [Candidatus Methylomirabilis sp.]|nr:WD40 repeat domain-containing protein [Candidatus Methylomirabilis sp.]
MLSSSRSLSLIVVAAVIMSVMTDAGRAIPSASAASLDTTVYSVAFSADGKILASTYQNTIRLWDVASGRRVAVLRGHSRGVSSIAVSSDGTRLVSGGLDGTVLIWTLPEGVQTHALRAHPRSVYTVTIAPDSRMAASGGSDQDPVIRLWDLRAGQLLRTLNVPTDVIGSLAFSPDGLTLASASGQQGDEGIALWDLRTDKVKARVGETNWAYVHRLAYSADGRMIVGAGGNRYEGGWTRVYDARTGELLDDTGCGASSIAFSPDSKILAIGFQRAIVLRNVSTGEPVLRLWGHTYLVESIAFSPDGTWLASGGNDLRLWDLRSGTLKRILR